MRRVAVVSLHALQVSAAFSAATVVRLWYAVDPAMPTLRIALPPGAFVATPLIPRAVRSPVPLDVGWVLARLSAVFPLGIVLQSPWFFLALSAVLWWSTLMPAHSLFDAIYNYAVAHPRNLPPLGVAPPPRRFAQGMAGAVALAIGGALLLGATITAWLLEGLFAVAVVRAVFGNFCVGAYVYHALRRLTAKSRVLSSHMRKPAVEHAPPR